MREHLAQEIVRLKRMVSDLAAQVEHAVQQAVEAAQQAMRDAGVTPRVVPIRGGTDGARLSFEGLPCPNLCTGGENFHGRFEYIPAEDMERITQLLAVMLWNLAE